MGNILLEERVKVGGGLKQLKEELMKGGRLFEVGMVQNEGCTGGKKWMLVKACSLGSNK